MPKFPPPDPNNIIGPAGFGDENFVTLDQVLPYTINFATEPSGNLPIQQVTITDQLSSALDWRTFFLGSFGFGGMTFTVPADSAFYQTTIDLSQTLGFDVNVTGTIDERTGIATWVFTTIDPSTGQIPTNPSIGFLPPDLPTGAGEGFVNYTVQAKSTDTTGTVISAQAQVTFLGQSPLDTNTVSNTIDASTPTSSVATLPVSTTSTSIPLNWSGTSNQSSSGISTYNVYVSDDGGAFTPFLTDTTATSATFNGQQGHTYGFYSVATNNAGTTQATPSAAQTSTTVLIPTTLTTVSGTGTFAGTGTLTATLPADGSGVADESVDFTLDNNGTITDLGTVTTGANGVATLPGVSLTGFNAGTATAAVGATFAGDATDENSSGGGNLTVSPAPATLSLSGLTPTYNGSAQAATVTTTPADLTGVTVTYTQNGNPVTSPTTAGSYAVTATLTNANYTATPVTGTLVINQATPIITWANPADITYGTALSATQLDATASFNGTTVVSNFAYTPAQGVVLNAGLGQTLSETFTPNDTTDYQTVTTTATINVDPATPLFSGLASPRITVGTAATTLSGQIAAGTVIPTGNVAITLNGVTEPAPITAVTGAFSVSFPTAALTTAGSPYPITYAYAANTNFNAANGSGTLTVSAQLGTPGTPKLDAASDTGVSNSDGLTKDNGSAAAPLIFDVSETGGSGDFFRLYDVTNSGAPVLIAGPVQATNGMVTVNDFTLADGTYKIAATTALSTTSTQSAISSSTTLTIQTGTTLSGTNPAENGFVTALPNGQVAITFSHPLAGPNAQGVMTPLVSGGAALSAKDPYAIFLLQRGPSLAFAAPSGIDEGDLPLHANTIYTVNPNDTSTITITPEEPLSSDVYGISVQLSAFTDLAGNTPTDPTGLNGFHAFLVQPLPPTAAALKVVGVTTYNGYTTVNNNPIFQPDTFAIKFNKPLWQGAVNFKAGPNNTIVASNNVQLLANVNGTYTVQPSVATYSPATDSIYLTPTGTLSPGTTYLIRVDGSVSDDQGFSGPDTNPGGTLGTTYYNTFTIINPPVAATSALLKVADDKNGNPETLPGNGLAWGLPLGYASVTFTNSVNLSPTVFTRFSAMLDPRTTGTDGNTLLTNIPLNAKLAFNPNTNQLIIVPTVLPANDTYVIALSNMQSSPTNPLLNPAGQVAGVTGLPFFASFGLNVVSSEAITAAAVSEGPVVVASVAPAAPVPLAAPSAAILGTVPTGPSPSFRATRPKLPAQALAVPKAPVGLSRRDVATTGSASRWPVGPLSL